MHAKIQTRRFRHNISTTGTCVCGMKRKQTTMAMSMITVMYCSLHTDIISRESNFGSTIWHVGFIDGIQ
jgi:hypothetical protein